VKLRNPTYMMNYNVITYYWW